MSSLKQTLQSDLTTAIRSRDELTSATLRMALTAVTTEEVSGTAARTLTDAEVMGVLTREAKRRREAAAALAALAREAPQDRWLALLQAELGQRMGNDAAARIHFRAAVSAGAEVYAVAAHADWLLDRPRRA